MTKGEIVRFKMWDDLLKFHLEGFGTLAGRQYGGLWNIEIKGQPGFLDGLVMVHEDFIKNVKPGEVLKYKKKHPCYCLHTGRPLFFYFCFSCRKFHLPYNIILGAP